ncbi:hypothetical protein EON67_08580, partial [archaeon]
MAVISAITTLSASADVLALAAVEVDLKSVNPGQTITVKWRGKPVFIKHRTDEQIAEVSEKNVSDLRHAQTDAERVKDPKWYVYTHARRLRAPSCSSLPPLQHRACPHDVTCSAACPCTCPCACVTPRWCDFQARNGMHSFSIVFMRACSVMFKLWMLCSIPKQNGSKPCEPKPPHHPQGPFVQAIRSMPGTFCKQQR